MARFLRLS